MGLDQYLYACEIGQVNADGKSDQRYIANWIPFPTLHSFMQREWTEAGRPDEDILTGEIEVCPDGANFNLIAFKLNLDICDRLLGLIASNGFDEYVKGFMYSERTRDDYTPLLELVEEVKAELLRGKTVWYDSFW